jgi:hypothetical protein
MPKKRNKAGKKLSVYKAYGLRAYSIRDETGMKLHAYINANGRLVIKASIKNKKKYYGRIKYDGARNRRSRTSSQEMLKARFERAGYHKTPTSDQNPHAVQYTNPPARRHTQVMLGVMRAKYGVGAQATANWYKTQVAVRDNGPAIPPGISFEWCHLVGHGLGGADAAGNLVAGTKGCNSEQLIIENAIWSYRDENRAQISIDVNCSLRQNGASVVDHLGGVIRYRILAGGAGEIYVRYIDCFRGTEPSGDLEARIHGEVVEAINRYLRTTFPVSRDELDDIEEAVEEADW